MNIVPALFFRQSIALWIVKCCVHQRNIYRQLFNCLQSLRIGSNYAKCSLFNCFFKMYHHALIVWDGIERNSPQSSLTLALHETECKIVIYSTENGWMKCEIDTFPQYLHIESAERPVGNGTVHWYCNSDGDSDVSDTLQSNVLMNVNFAGRSLETLVTSGSLKTDFHSQQHRYDTCA